MHLRLPVTLQQLNNPPYNLRAVNRHALTRVVAAAKKRVVLL